MSERWPMFANLRTLLSRMRNSFRGTSLDRDLEAEMASHLQFAIEDNLKSGMSQKEARRQAQLTFGGPQQSKEAHRDSRGLPFLDSVLQDLRFALRLFRKAPSFSVSAILTLALGIGATTAIFSVVYGVLLRPLPYPQPDRIVRLWEQGANRNRMNFADPNFEDIRSQNKSLLAVAEYNSGFATVAGSLAPQTTIRRRHRHGRRRYGATKHLHHRQRSSRAHPSARCVQRPSPYRLRQCRQSRSHASGKTRARTLHTRRARCTSRPPCPAISRRSVSPLIDGRCTRCSACSLGRRCASCFRSVEHPPPGKRFDRQDCLALLRCH